MDVTGWWNTKFRAIGQSFSENSISNSTELDVNALPPGIEVNKIADPSSGAPSTKINFTINVTNIGKVALKTVEAKDALPFGLNYVSDDRNGTESKGVVIWSNLGPLEPDESTIIHLFAHINGSRFGVLTNKVSVTGQPPTGNPVNNSTKKNVTAFWPNIEVNKTAIPEIGVNSTEINFTINITNTGNITLDLVEINDTLPDGLSYVRDDSGGIESGNIVTWSNLGPLAPGGSRFIQLVTKVDGDVLGKLINLVNVTGRPPSGDDVTNSTTINVTAISLSIFGRKFNDLNGNGTHDGDPDPGIANWTIELVNATTGRVVRTALTNVSGLYQFDNVPRGNYIVREEHRSGWLQTCPSAPGYYNIIVDHADVNEMDFGNQEVHSIFGRKFNDLNGNGTHDDDPDPGIPNWTIELVNATAGQVVRTALTNVSGLYQFDNVPRGSYIVREEHRSGWLQTCPSSPGYYSIIVDHADVNEMDFGNQEVHSIFGRKFNDLNGNGTHDGDPDPGIANWTIELVNATTGRVARTALTNVSGLYQFDNVPRGNYIVREENRSGWLQTCPPLPGYYSIIVDHADVNEMDFGNTVPAVLGDFVWKDMNRNGIQEDIERSQSGYAGVVIKLYSAAGSALERSPGDCLFETETDSKGYYRFSGLVPGEYRLKFEPPQGSRFCARHQCPDEERDSDAGCDGWTDVIQLYSGETNLSWDAGIVLNSSLDVTKEASPASGSPGAEIGFNIGIKNSGETYLRHVTARDTLPEGMTYVSNNRSGAATGRIISWADLGNLAPGESTGIQIVARIDQNVSGLLTNFVVANATDPADKDCNDTAIARVRSLIPDIDVIKQYGQYCEAKKISGKGIVESSTKIVDKRIALDYDDSMAGEGDMEIESEKAMSEAADKLQRDVPTLDPINKSNLNLFESSKIEFEGPKPLTGGKSIQSVEFYGGSGAKIQESFSTEKMEKSQTVFFGSTLDSSSPHFVGMALKSSFKGTEETDSTLHMMLMEDIASRQRLSGTFDLEKSIKLREKATKLPRAKRMSGCDGIDC